jgi:hypothetical protein
LNEGKKGVELAAAYFKGLYVQLSGGAEGKHKIRKVYSLEYTKIPKVFFTPRHGGDVKGNVDLLFIERNNQANNGI